MSWCLGRSWKTRKGQGHSGSCAGENINWLLLKLCQKWSVREVITGMGCLPFYSKLIVKGKFLDFKAWHHNVRQLYQGDKPHNCCGVKPRAPFSFERDTNLPLRWHGFSFVICFAILTVLMGSLGLWDVFRAPAELTPKAQRASSRGAGLLSVVSPQVCAHRYISQLQPLADMQNVLLPTLEIFYWIRSGFKIPSLQLVAVYGCAK